MKDVSIGVCFRDGEKNILNTLQSIMSLSFGNLDVEIILCHNGPEGETLQMVQKYINNRNILLLKTNIEGKMHAQRCILDKKSASIYTCFCDSDILLHRQSLLAMYNTLQKKKNIHLTYLDVIPDASYGNNKLSRFFNIHYKVRDIVLSERKYFHGRCFMFRDVTVIPHYKKLGMKKTRFRDVLPVTCYR